MAYLARSGTAVAIKKIEINKELRADYTKLNRATLPGHFLEAEERRLSLNLLARYVHGWE
jgi:hypothetical protein